MMKSSQYLTAWLFLFLFFLPVHAAQAQVDSTLIRIRTLNPDSAQTNVPVYFSSGFEDRANALSKLLEKADRFLIKSLGIAADLNLAVLDEQDWPQVWPFPYGIPYVSLQSPWVVVIPAKPKESVLFAGISAVLSPDQAATMIDNIGFHEVSHIYISEYLYPDDFKGAPPVRWLDEFLAQYLAYAFMKEVSTARVKIWDSFTTGTLNGPAPRYTSLDAFEKEYYGFLGTPNGSANYGWYQSAFAKQAADIYDDRGLRFLESIKQNLPWDNFENWTTHTILKELEKIIPGFISWHDDLAKSK